MNKISNRLLIDSYQKGKSLNLDPEFMNLLKEEIVRRGLLTYFL